MRIFILFFLLGAACANPVSDALEDDTDILAQLDSFPLKEYLALAADADDDKKPEIVEKLKEHLEDVLTKIKDAIDKGKTVGKELFEKVKEIKEKLKDLHVELGEKLKDLLEKVKQKYKDFFKKLLDKILGKEETKRNIKDLSDIQGNSLRESLEKALQNLKDAIKNFKIFLIPDLLEKIGKVWKEIKEHAVEIGEKARELIRNILENAPFSVKKFFEKLGILEESKRNIKDLNEIQSKLRETLEKALQDLKDAIKNARLLLIPGLLDKIRTVWKEIRDKAVEIGEKARELIKQILENAPFSVKKVFEDLGILEKSKRNIENLSDIQGDFVNLLEQLKEKLKNRDLIFPSFLQKIGDAYKEILKKSADIGDKARQLLEEIAERGTLLVKEFLRRFGLLDSKRAAEAETDEVKSLRKVLDYILEKIDSAIKKGEAIEEKFLDKAKEVIQKLKEKKAELKEKAKELIERIRERAIDYLRKLLGKLDSKDEHKRSVEDTKNDLHRQFDDILERIKDAIEKGKDIKEEHLKKLKELKQKLKDIGSDIGERAKELLKNIVDKAKDALKRILEKLRFKDTEERSLGDDTEVIAHALSIKDFLRKIRDLIETHVDLDSIKEIVQTKYCKGRGVISSELCDYMVRILGEKGEKVKQKILDLINHLLGDDIEKRSLKEAWDKVKEFFDKIKVHLKEKFVKLGGYIKEKFGKILEDIKDKHEVVKEIARQFKDHAKEVSKEIAEEALEFLRPYKDDLGKLYEQVVAALKDVIKTKEE